MKKIILLITFLIVLSNFVSAINCDDLSCNYLDYVWADFSNSANGTTPSQNDATNTIQGYDAGSSATYDNTEYINTSPFGIHVDHSGSISARISMADIAQIGNFNATCVDFTSKWTPSGDLDNFGWSFDCDGGAWNALKSHGNDCGVEAGDYTKFCYSIGGSWTTTGIVNVVGRTYTFCYYDRGGAGSYNDGLLIDWEGGVNHTITGATGNYWSADCFDSGSGTMGIGVESGTGTSPTIVLDNWRLFNGSFGKIGVLDTSQKDFTPPNITNAICTSCNTDNETADTTPTVNVTCKDDTGCQMVRIANDSSYTFDTAGTSRNCTQGVVATWVCTLPTSDQLSNLDIPQPVYFWANDTINNSHSNFNLTMNITLVSPFVKLNGLSENRTYEYETTANITTSFSFIDILDGTFRYRNQVSPVNYTINLLRINEFNGSNETINLSSGSSYAVLIDNRTDLYNASINITGYSNPGNATLNYTHILNFPGILMGSNLYQNQFIYQGVPNIKKNITFIAAETKTIWINCSNQGNILTRQGYLNFTLTGFTFNEEDAIIYRGNFTNNSNEAINGSYFNSDNITIFGNSTLDAIDDFEDGNVNSWDGGAVIQTRADGNDYLKLYGSGTSSGNTQTTFQNEEFDMRYAYEFSTDSSIMAQKSCTYPPAGYGCSSGGGTITVYMTDGTTDVILFTQSEQGGPAASYEYNLSGVRTSDTTIDIFSSAGFQSSVNLDPLDSNERWTIKLYGAWDGDNFPSTSGTADFKIYSLSLSGPSLRLKTNYSINNPVNFTTKTLATTEETIVTALLNATVYIPTGTDINFYMSNNNITWEPVTNGQNNIFTTLGDNLSVRYELSTELYNVTPRVYKYSVTISSGSLRGLTIDVGDDEIYDMIINYTINSTTTPLNYAGNDSGINNYINSTSSNEHILIPITLISTSSGVLQISDVNLTENINPISLNISAIQDLSSIPFSLVYQDGTIQLSDVKFDYRGNKTILIIAHGGDYSSSKNLTLQVEHSPFNVSILPANIDYWNIGPNIYKWVQNNIPPFGNADGNGNPFWNVTKNTWDHPVNIYVGYNESLNSCQKTWFTGNQTITLNTSAQLIVDNITTNNLAHNISTLTNISCGSINSTLLFPYNCWISMCSECVLTQDWESNCELIN